MAILSAYLMGTMFPGEFPEVYLHSAQIPRMPTFLLFRTHLDPLSNTKNYNVLYSRYHLRLVSSVYIRIHQRFIQLNFSEYVFLTLSYHMVNLSMPANPSDLIMAVHTVVRYRLLPAQQEDSLHSPPSKRKCIREPLAEVTNTGE